jgi:uncharacterized protein YecT (DUF1311 family)
MVATAALLIGTVTPCMADPAEMDEWCSTDAHLPSSIAICSDPVLRELAVQRNRAFEAGRDRLSVNAYNALQQDQKGWVHSYSTACGLSQTIPPALSLQPQILECMKRSGQARVEYLWNYVGVNASAGSTKPDVNASAGSAKPDAVIPRASYASDIPDFDAAVRACKYAVSAQYPGFDAYVEKDSFPRRVKYFGSNRTFFMFEKCMNDSGHPTEDVK